MEEALKRILPAPVLAAIESRLNYKKLFEIRLRAGHFASVNYGGKLYYLSSEGLCQMQANAIKICARSVHDTVVRASDFSLYAVNDQLKKGFITIKGGVRVGVAGEVVKENSSIKTIKNFSSVNIRVPHEVIGCSDKVYSHCFGDRELNSCLIISAPGAGKTTILRDLARKLGDKEPRVSVLVVDERSELAAQHMGLSGLNVGVNSDIIASGSKEYAFSAGIRTLAPDIIITDELASSEDAQAVAHAKASGVAVIASIHGKTVDDIKQKKGFLSLIEDKVFDRYIELSNRNGPGTIETIKDGELKVLWTL